MKNDCHFVQEEFKIQKEIDGSHSQLADATERTQILTYWLLIRFYTTLVRFLSLWQNYLRSRNSLKEETLILSCSFRGFSPWLPEPVDCFGSMANRMVWLVCCGRRLLTLQQAEEAEREREQTLQGRSLMAHILKFAPSPNSALRDQASMTRAFGRHLRSNDNVQYCVFEWTYRSRSKCDFTVEGRAQMTPSSR